MCMMTASVIDTLMTARTIADVDARLQTLEALFDERWTTHEKHASERWTDVQSIMKDIDLKLRLLQDQSLVLPAEVDARIKKKILEFKNSFWKMIGFMFVCVPTLLYAVFELANLLVSKL